MTIKFNDANKQSVLIQGAGISVVIPVEDAITIQNALAIIKEEYEQFQKEKEKIAKTIAATQAAKKVELGATKK